jgi:hypothetical protein
MQRPGVSLILLSNKALFIKKKTGGELEIQKKWVCNRGGGYGKGGV